MRRPHTSARIRTTGPDLLWPVSAGCVSPWGPDAPRSGVLWNEKGGGLMSGRGRVVALSNGLIATALVAVLAAVALVVRPPAPPGIAEFAPQATKPITKAPPGQAALHGSGAGTCAAGQSCLAARPTPSAVPTAVP